MAVMGKINVIERGARFVYDLPKRHIDAFEQGFPTAPFLGRQRGQEAIFPEIVVSLHE